MHATLRILIAELVFGVTWQQAGAYELSGTRYLGFNLPFTTIQVVISEILAMALGIGVVAIACWWNSYGYTSYSALILNEPFITSLMLSTMMIKVGYKTVWRMFRVNKACIPVYSVVSGTLSFGTFPVCIYCIKMFAQPTG